MLNSLVDRTTLGTEVAQGCSRVGFKKELTSGLCPTQVLKAMEIDHHDGVFGKGWTNCTHIRRAVIHVSPIDVLQRGSTKTDFP